MNRGAISPADRQLILPGLQSETEMDGRESQDGFIPARVAAINWDIDKRTLTVNKSSAEKSKKIKNKKKAKTTA